MPGPKPPEIKLADEERQGLEKLVRRHITPQQIALRGRIILSAADGKNNGQIAQEFGIHVDTPRLWRRRWLTLSPISLDDLSVEERLEDLPREIRRCLKRKGAAPPSQKHHSMNLPPQRDRNQRDRQRSAGKNPPSTRLPYHHPFGIHRHHPRFDTRREDSDRRPAAALSVLRAVPLR